MGNGTVSDKEISPVLIDSGSSGWTDVSTGFGNSFAIQNGSLYGWGMNDGRLGDGTTSGNQRLTPYRIGTNSDWTDVEGGVFHTLGLRDNNKLFAWGRNSFGKLGTGDTDNRYSPVQIGSSTWSQISAGNDQSLAIRQVADPVNNIPPTVSGTPRVGQTLTSSEGTWSNTPTLSYQWQRCETASEDDCENISGATSSNYVLTADDAGKFIRVQVTGANTDGTAVAFSDRSSAVRQNPVVSIPTISGTVKVGQTLTAAASATAGVPAPSITYQWQIFDPAGTSGWTNITTDGTGLSFKSDRQ